MNGAMFSQMSAFSLVEICPSGTQNFAELTLTSSFHWRHVNFKIKIQITRPQLDVVICKHKKTTLYRAISDSQTRQQIKPIPVSNR